MVAIFGPSRLATIFGPGWWFGVVVSTAAVAVDAAADAGGKGDFCVGAGAAAASMFMEVGLGSRN